MDSVSHQSNQRWQVVQTLARLTLNCSATELTIVLAVSAGLPEMQFWAAVALPFFSSSLAHAWSSCMRVTELPVKELVTDFKAASNCCVRLVPMDETSP